MSHAFTIKEREPGRAYLVVDCGKQFGPIKQCLFPLWKIAPQFPMWNWDGNIEKPTISPSVACQLCGWHVVITNGVAT